MGQGCKNRPAKFLLKCESTGHHMPNREHGCWRTCPQIRQKCQILKRILYYFLHRFEWRVFSEVRAFDGQDEFTSPDKPIKPKAFDDRISASFRKSKKDKSSQIKIKD